MIQSLELFRQYKAVLSRSRKKRDNFAGVAPIPVLISSACFSAPVASFVLYCTYLSNLSGGHAKFWNQMVTVSITLCDNYIDFCVCSGTESRTNFLTQTKSHFSTLQPMVDTIFFSMLLNVYRNPKETA
eukprot:g67439.t1